MNDQATKSLTAIAKAQADLKALALEQLRLQYVAQHADYAEKPLACYSERSFSQNGEDGVIAEIFRRFGEKPKSFVEIGTGDGTENNTIMMLLEGAKGVWLEGSDEFVAKARDHHAAAIAKGDLKVERAMITAENVNKLISSSHGAGDLDLLSIDIDGNDYWVWKAVNGVKPKVVVMEFNGAYGSSLSWTMAYDANYSWSGGHRYYGASLKALEHLGREKGYALVGVEFMGVNAFFVRADLVVDRFPGPHTSEALFQPFRRMLAQMMVGKAVRFGAYARP